MVASMFAKWTGDRLFKGSIYDVQIRLNHYPYLQFDKTSNKMVDSFASDIMHPRLVHRRVLVAMISFSKMSKDCELS